MEDLPVPGFVTHFLYEDHVRYLLKSLKKSYSVDIAESHRLSSLFFVVSGLDLLGALDTRLSPKDKEDIIEWIYSHQVSVKEVKIKNPNSDDLYKKVGHAGFRATSMINSDIPLDCGNITMTFCALATLIILGDDLSRVDKKSIIDGMRHLQLPDGSFIPFVLGGESDMRLVYCATAVSYILNDWSGMDRDKCSGFIKSCFSYEGAFAQCPGAEAHGGSTFCALASLKLMSKLDETMNGHEIDRLSGWCLRRLGLCGFSGRPNKDDDTCYSFWIGSCLVMLDHFKFIQQENILYSLLAAQEQRGGLSKVPCFFSDPLHTYLGLAGLTFIDDKLCTEKRINLRKLCPTLMISMRSREHLATLHESWMKQEQKT